MFPQKKYNWQSYIDLPKRGGVEKRIYLKNTNAIKLQLKMLFDDTR